MEYMRHFTWQFLSLRKCKLKQHWETTPHLLEWPKSNTDSTKCWQGCGATGTLSHGWWGCKLVQPLRKTVSHKTKHILPVWSRIHTPWRFPEGVENLCPYKILHLNVYSSFIHHCQKLEATKMPFSRWMDKNTVVPPDSGILLSAYKKWVICPWKDTEEL